MSEDEREYNDICPWCGSDRTHPYTETQCVCDDCDSIFECWIIPEKKAND